MIYDTRAQMDRPDPLYAKFNSVLLHGAFVYSCMGLLLQVTMLFDTDMLKHTLKYLILLGRPQAKLDALNGNIQQYRA